MAGTKSGGLETAKTNKAKYGESFYADIGKLGGEAPHTGLRGFAANKERATEAGRKGGQISKRRARNA